MALNKTSDSLSRLNTLLDELSELTNQAAEDKNHISGGKQGPEKDSGSQKGSIKQRVEEIVGAARQSALELSLPRERLEFIMDQMEEGYIAFDQAGRFLEINTTAEQQLLAGPAGGLHERTYLEIFPDAVESEFHRQFEVVCEDQQPVQFEMKWQSTGRWLALRGYPRGGIIEFFIRDISEQKQAKAELQDLARLPQENPNPVLCINRQGIVLYGNPPAIQLLAERGCRVGEPAPEFLRGLAFDALHDGQKRMADYPYDEHVIAFTIVPFAEQGYVNLYGSNMTERREVEERLRVSNDRLQNVLSSITEAYFVLDEEWRIVDYNAVAQHEFLKKPKSELLGKVFWEEFPQAIGNEYYRQYHRAFETGQAVHFEGLSGLAPKWYEVHAYPRGGRLEIYLHNIDERKHTEQRLAYQANLLENIHDAVIATDLENKITSWNRAAETMYGWRAEEVLGQDLNEVIPSALTKEELYAYREELKRTGRFQAEMIHYDRDGRALSIDVHEISLRDPSGRINGYASANRDITFRKQAEDKLKAALLRAESAQSEALAAQKEALAAAALALRREQVLETVFNAMTEAVTLFDKDGKIVQVNPSARAYFGMDPVGLDRVAYAQSLPLREPDDQPLAPDSLPVALALQGETVRDHQLRFTNPRGEVYDIVASAAPLYIDNQLVGAVLVWRDVTEREQLLRSLREISERFDVALRNAPVSVYTLDRDLRFTWVYKPVYNFQVEQMLGRRDDELLPPEEVAELVAFKQQVVESGKGKRTEITLKIEGRERFFDITIEPLRNAEGAVSGLTVAWIDITGQRRLEAEALERIAQIEIQREILRHREQERLEIARDLHDGPLQDMIGLSFSLTDMVNTDDKSERLEKIEEIQESLQAQIDNVRAFCSELRPPALAPFGVERAIRAHMESVREKNRHIQFHLDTVRDGKTLPEETRMALFRVFQESLNNIIKHSGATEAWVRFQLDDEQVELEVRDNGQGFTRPANLVSLARQGHLGLVGMQERVDAVGGELVVKSMPGEGTQVRVEIQRKDRGTLA